MVTDRELPESSSSRPTPTTAAGSGLCLYIQMEMCNLTLKAWMQRDYERQRSLPPSAISNKWVNIDSTRAIP